MVDDYPYGFRLRTSIRYWIEQTKRGERFVSQTLNPKTNRWNKPKKSTYSDMMVMVENDNGHISHDGFSIEDGSQEGLDRFLKVAGEAITPFHEKKIKLAGAVFKTRKHITCEIVAGPTFSFGEMNRNNPKFQAEIKRQEERKEEQKVVSRQINRVFHHYLAGGKDLSTEVE